MAKLKDGFYKQTAEAIGSDLHVLLAGGGSKALTDFAYKSDLTGFVTGGPYLPLSGGTITGTLKIYRDAAAINYCSSGGSSHGWLGFSEADVPRVWLSNGSTSYPLLHTGNYSGYLDGRYYTETEVNNLLSNYLPINGTAAHATSASALACGSFDTASQITTAYAQWTNYSGCSDVPSMGYAAVLNVGYGNYRWWQIWNARHDHQLYWRPEKSDASGWADVHILIDNKNITNYLPVVTNYYWADQLITNSAKSNATPTFGNVNIKSGTDAGLGIFTSGDYSRIRFYNSANENKATIHYFATAYSGYTFAKDTLNIGGLTTIGAWNNPTMYVTQNTSTTNKSGKVGIQTTSPTSTLDVNGDVAANYYKYKIFGSNLPHASGDAWYNVYQGTIHSTGDTIILNLSHSFWYTNTDAVSLAITVGYGNASINQISATGGSGIFKKVRVRFDTTTVWIDVLIYSYTASTDTIYVSGLGKGDFKTPTATSDSSNTKAEISIFYSGAYFTSLKTDQIRGPFVQYNYNIWLSPAYLQLGRADATVYTDRGCIGITNGNLHIDAYKNKDIYLNYYQSPGTSGQESTSVVVKPSGKVGIGTASPIHKLQVDGAGVFKNTGSTTYNTDGITIGAGDVAQRYITCYGKTGISYFNMGYAPSANNCAELVFAYAGDGNSSNYSALSLYGADNQIQIYPGFTKSAKYIQAPNYVAIDNGYAYYWGASKEYFLGSNTTEDFYFWSTSSSARLRIGTKNLERMTVLSNGCVGINITSPNEILHINGNFKIQGTSNTSTKPDIYLGYYTSWNGATYPTLMSGYTSKWIMHFNPHICKSDSIDMPGSNIRMQSTSSNYYDLSVAYDGNDYFRLRYNNNKNLITVTNNGKIYLSNGIIFTGEIGSNVGTYVIGDSTALYLAANETNKKVFLESTNQSCPYFRNKNGDYAIYHEGNTTEGYVMRGYTIDASGLNEDTWYPVTFYVGSHANVRIECRVSLNSGTVPSWSTHTYGFSVRKIWETNGSGWGTNPVSRRVLVSNYTFTSTDPVRGIGQLTNSSYEYVYVRGGGRYYFYTSHNIAPTLRTSDFTQSSQTVSVTTSTPAGISVDVGATSTVYVYDSDHNSTYRMVWHSGNTLYGTGGIYCNPSTDYLYAASMNASDWFRSSGNTGWYNSTYAGGIYMEDTTWVRIFNGKKFYVSNSSSDAIHSAGGVYVAGAVHAYANYLKSTCNSCTVTIGSQNSSYCHYDTTAPRHWFNKPVYAQGDFYGGASYNRRLAYADELPSVGNGTVTITQNGANMGSFTMNQSGNTTIALTDNNTNYYPIRSYTSGLQISSYSGSADCQLYVPNATYSQAGVVTTADQTFAGQKTFASIRLRSGGTGNSGGYLYFGDGSYAYLAELADDKLTLNATTLYLGISGTQKYYIDGTIFRPVATNSTSTTGIALGNSSYRFTYGYFAASVYAYTGFYESSDERLKTILNPVKINLEKLSELRKVYYSWKNDSDNKRQLGTIAQDVQKLFPEIVSEDSETGYLSLAYDKLSVVALAAIDELYDMIKTLRKENEELKRRLLK